VSRIQLQAAALDGQHCTVAVAAESSASPPVLFEVRRKARRSLPAQGGLGVGGPRFFSMWYPLVEKEASGLVDAARKGLMPQEYVEAIVVLKEGAHRGPTKQWLASHGLAAASMRAGLLASGAKSSFQSAFGADLREVDNPQHGKIDLPIPDELQEYIISISIQPNPRYHP